MPSGRALAYRRRTTRRTAWLAAAVVALLSATVRLGAQAAIPPDTSHRAAAPADVQSMDAILHAAYDAISGPAGPRDWPRFYTLFAPDARLILTRRDSTTGKKVLFAMTTEKFAQLAGASFSTRPFYEREIGREYNTFGAVTQVFSTYASFAGPNDPRPFQRGINSFQLFNDGTRWYIVTIYWDIERPDLPIPERYLHVQP